jgi:hypothetical protein
MKLQPCRSVNFCKKVRDENSAGAKSAHFSPEWMALSQLYNHASSRSRLSKPISFCSLQDSCHSLASHDLFSARNRGIFPTKDGYMGLGPLAMEEDETVIDLFGDDVPYILRPKRDICVHW